MREVGVYARDPEEGEILYRLYRMDQGVPVNAGDTLVLRLELAETVSEAAQVTVEGTAAGLLTQGELDALRGVPEGLATLDERGTVPTTQLPYSWGTEELTAGESPLETGTLYFTYE